MNRLTKDQCDAIYEVGKTFFEQDKDKLLSDPKSVLNIENLENLYKILEEDPRSLLMIGEKKISFQEMLMGVEQGWHHAQIKLAFGF